jgi:4-hydroxy-4-methyl-2-oxoglutarate aldolase
MENSQTAEVLFSSADVANALVPASFIVGLTPAWPGARCLGPARTVLGVGGDNLALYHALNRCEPGDVLVADLGGSRDFGHWGDLLSRAALARGVAGLVIDGAVRDGEVLAQLRFPVFHRGFAPRTASKKAYGQVDVALAGLADAPILPGDLVVADADGIAVVPASVSRTVLSRAVADLEDKESEIARRIATGASLEEAFSLGGLL